MDYQLLSESPVPIWGVALDPIDRHPAPSLGDRPVIDLFRSCGGLKFRGVGLDRLPVILATGVDVTPTDAPIYCAEIDKAWEYGKFPKAIMAFRGRLDGRRLLCPTYHVANASTREDELAELRKTYPFEFPGQEEGERFLSRIDDPSPARRAYQCAYGWWIPGDPFQALVAVFVYGSTDDLRGIECALGEVVGGDSARL